MKLLVKKKLTHHAEGTIVNPDGAMKLTPKEMHMLMSPEAYAAHFEIVEDIEDVKGLAAEIRYLANHNDPRNLEKAAVMMAEFIGDADVSKALSRIKK